MFDFFFKNKKTVLDSHNDVLLKKVFEKLKAMKNENSFKTRIILEYLDEAFKNENVVEEIYSTVYLSKERTKEFKELNELFLMKSPLKDKKFIHWKNGDIYTLKGIALPVNEIIFEKFDEVFHTEEEVMIPYFSYENYFYHNYNNEVLVIYTKDQKTYARPYENFFDDVEDEGIIIPRFKKI